MISESSLAYRVDQSAPIAGYVYDGYHQNATDSIRDIDYQVDSKTLYSYWEGFHDPHSVIKMYYISIGTCPYCQNVLNEIAVGVIYGYYVYFFFSYEVRLNEQYLLDIIFS